ncbi:BglII/BstYI family type II restriction endonuclease [Plasticicumulans sp.]|uniref:BglII/BstYI family type II restriction endonuclease n=1 Tax=Plasticicumulans sp. TaxID=2307179 RepID=UPI0039374660
MRIAAYYSHLNGWEYLQVHQPDIWKEIQDVIESVDASKCKTKVSKERGMIGNLLYSPKNLNESMRLGFNDRGWRESRVSYWVTENAQLIRKTMLMDAKQQKAEIEAAGYKAIASYNQTDFVKDRVAVEVQFGKYSFVAFDLFVKHLAFYVRDVIDVGIEILPMKVLQSEMSSGPGYYEGELYNLIREGRGVPAVPLVLIGVAP